MCPGRSTCFLDPEFNCYAGVDGKQPWGWNIEYTSTDGVIDDCEVLIKAKNCEGGQKVGFAIITKDAFVISIDTAKYPANSYSFAYNFYAGECIGSDSGNHLKSGVCLADDVAKYARDPSSYPLTSGHRHTTTFAFDSTYIARGEWGADYAVFPIGEEKRTYLSAHVEICTI